MARQRDLSHTLRSGMLDKLDASLLTGRIGRRLFMQWSITLGVTAVGARARADELDEARANQDARSANLAPEYDVIICGAGTCGCTLAGNLAEAGLKTLLIEDGDWDTSPAVLDPRQWFMNLGTDRDWGDVATPTQSVNGRAIASHMGRVLGGGSSINATIWVRGHRNNYDGWAEAAGDHAWGYDNALAVFKHVENWQGAPSPKYRGVGGRVWVQTAHDPLPIAPAMLEAAKSLGLPVYDDLNGAREEAIGGFALMNQIIKDGRRVNMAHAFLYLVLAKPNLTVLTRTHADRLVIENGHAVGIEVMRNGESRTLRASREVVLSLGAIRSPKILMLSGIGDRMHLAEHGIDVKVHAPEVGQNFHDHILHGGCLWEAPEQMTYQNSGSNASGFWKSNPALDTPDLNIVQIELPYASEVIAKQFAPPKTSWAMCAGLVGPKSRGNVRLGSARPADAPVVNARFLEHPDDIKALMKGIDLCRSLGNASAMRPWVKREVAPGRDLDDAAKADFIRNGATTFFHQVGTCRMGKDDASVVDAQLRVRGIDGLRVADGSIMPKIVSCATMASCVFIAERMAGLLLEK